MAFKSGNWSHIKACGTRVRVEYTVADLILHRTGVTIPGVQTTVVVLWNDDCRYVGIAQCSPRDAYSREKGREIAAGRALKEFNRHCENPHDNPSDVWECEGQTVHIFGDMPEDIDDGIGDHMMFE